MAANEASAIGSLRVVNSAQLSYNTTCAQGSTSEAQTIFQHAAAITAISAAGVPSPNTAVPVK